MRFVSICIALFFAFLSSGTVVHADRITDVDERALRLRDDVVALYEKSTDASEWQSEKGPWQHYLLDDYASVLSKQERALYFRSLIAGHCPMVETLQEVATLKVYPFLVQAHSSVAVSEKFRETVALSTDDRRACFKMWRLGKLLRLLKSKGLSVDLRNKVPERVEKLRVGNSFKADVQDEPDESDVSEEQRAKNSVCWAVRQLTDIAMQSSSIAPTKALVELSKFPQLLRLPDEHRYAIAKRAKVLGLADPALLKEIEDVFYRVEPKRRAMLDKRAVRPGWRILLDFSWSCGFPLYSVGDLHFLP